MIRTRSWALDALALTLLAGYAALLLRRTLLQGGAMVGYDLYTYFYPAKVFASAAVRRGELPLWNPYVYFGAPFLANIQMAVLYPPDALFYVLDFPRAVALSQWLHLTIGGAGMYALCRAGWGLDRPAALAGALTFAGSGFFAAHMGHLNQVHGGVWLPWIALCAYRLAMARQPWRGAVPWFVAGSTAVALAIAAGHTQEVYYSLFAAGALAAAFTLLPPARAAGRWGHVPALGAIVAGGALLSAAQLVPTLELSRLSYRQGGIPIDEAVAYSVDRTHILESVLPTFWSLPSQEVTGYVGVVALLLSAAALAGSGARRQVLPLAALALLALALSLGAYTPLYGLLHRWLPLFGSFRAPGRWLLVACFALAGLAGHGAHALRWSPCPQRRERAARDFGLALTGGAALLALFIWRTSTVHAIQWLPHARVAALWALAGLATAALGLTGIFSRTQWPRLALVAALAAELAFAAREMEYNQPETPEVYARIPAVAPYLDRRLAQLRDNGAPTDRVLSLAVEERLDPERLSASVPAGGDLYKHYAAMGDALKPNLGVPLALPTIDGYDGGLLPTRAYARFKELLVTGEPPVPHLTLPAQAGGKASASLLASLNVRFLLTDGRGGPPGDGWTTREDAPGGAWVYENGRVAPRAFLVTDVLVEPDADRALDSLASLDLTRTAVVAATPAPSPASSPAPGATSIAGDARIVRYGARDVEVETRSAVPALLVLTDTLYPGWRATVDSTAAPIVATDVLFRGVALPAGTHRVRFRFDPLSVKLGFVVSALTAAGDVALLAWWARPERGAGRGGVRRANRGAESG